MAKFSKTTIMILILIVIYVAFLLSTDITKVQNNLKTMNYSYLLIAIALWSSGNIFRIIRWHLFLKEIEDKVPFKENVLYYLAGFAFLLSPGRLGEIIRSPYIKRDYGISIPKTASIVFVERFYELLGIIIVLSVGLVFIEFQRTILLVPLAIIVVAIVVFKNKKLLFNLLNKISKIKLLKNISTNFEESYNTIAKLSKPKFFVIGTITSTIRAFLMGLAVYFLVLSLSAKLSFEEVLVIFPASQLVAALSMIPGGIGIFDGGIVGLFFAFNVPYDIAITTTILMRIIGIGIFSVIGLIFLRLIASRN